MRCPHCDNELTTDARFCGRCGAPVMAAPAPRRRARRWPLWLLLGLTGALLGYGGSWLWQRGDQQTEATPTRASWVRALAPAPTASLAPSATPSPTQTPSPTPSSTPSPTPTASLTATALWTLTATATWTPAPTATATTAPTATPLPTCALAVEDGLAEYYGHGQLGCPLRPAHITWGAWQPFERGYMLWRKDTGLVTIFYGDGSHQTLADQWHDGPEQNLSPPAGRTAPKRGFGWLWVNAPGVADGLGWGLAEEKGFCLLIQDFEAGALLKSVTSSCGSEYNRAKDADFAPFVIRKMDEGSWVMLPR